ncbi:MAG TPA: Hpt domain-containing protein [Casimicrobiaceae bacterium]|jgi:HPt (histidine-containing phosphotransfer) domain-containing protein|nr:Hpt domain-containing protein [Casimicrobiaceae bacterium]
MNEGAIDRAAYDGLVESTGDDFARELVSTFLAEAPRMLDELRDAFAKDDAERFRRVAHSLKSNANTFGALTLGRLARELELGGLAPIKSAAAAPIDAAASEYARVSKALEDLTRG